MEEWSQSIGWLKWNSSPSHHPLEENEALRQLGDVNDVKSTLEVALGQILRKGSTVLPSSTRFLHFVKPLHDHLRRLAEQKQRLDTIKSWPFSKPFAPLKMERYHHHRNRYMDLQASQFRIISGADGVPQLISHWGALVMIQKTLGRALLPWSPTDTITLEEPPPPKKKKIPGVLRYSDSMGFLHYNPGRCDHRRRRRSPRPQGLHHSPHRFVARKFWHEQSNKCFHWGNFFVSVWLGGRGLANIIVVWDIGCLRSTR